MKSRSGLGATPFKSPDFNDPFFSLCRQSHHPRHHRTESLNVDLTRIQW
jgi:hypothetical protein